MSDTPAFGRPGIAPTWSPSDKDLVFTALGSSRLWVTLGHGIVNEVYWPATGDPQIRDLGFILARRDGWIELKRVARYRITLPRPQVPLPRVVHHGHGYRLTLEVVPDPTRDVLLLSYGLLGDYDLYLLLAPHLGGSGRGNTAWVDGWPFARGGDAALALVGSVPFVRASAGYVGASDGWQDFARNGEMTWAFARAEEGNVALLAQAGSRSGVLALGFAHTPEGAHTVAASSLAEGFEAARAGFVAGWEEWATGVRPPLVAPRVEGALQEAWLSAIMLKVHEDRAFPGALVASLSVPWGNASDSTGGYHLVWTRDAVEAAFGLLAVGQREDAERVLAYLVATQLPDGHWHQNFFPDGRPYFGGIQLDEAGFPILLAAKLLERGRMRVDGVSAMVRRAAAYLARSGPGTLQDRWEEDGGESPFTLAVEIAALVASAAFLCEQDGDYGLSLADCWNERIEQWCYVEDTRLARELGIPGHYLRIGPTASERDRVGLEFLALVRFGLRRADDGRIGDSLRVADAVLRVDTPSGPLYHRYEGDRYGEHADGRPYDGAGIGRAWPLLTGERGHLALALGEDPAPYLATMMRTSGRCGLLPEQAWDRAPIPGRDLRPGKPSGSAMPLVWAHAEFLQLLVGRELGRPFQLLRVVEDRYQGRRPMASTWHWRTASSFPALPAARALLIEDDRPFVLHYGLEGWSTVRDRAAEDQGLGMYGVRFEATELAPFHTICFTRRYADRWEGADHTIVLRTGARA